MINQNTLKPLNMNREIKFRGRTDGEQSKWVYGCLVNNLWVYSEHAKYPKGSNVCEIITGKYDGDSWEDVAEDCDDAIVTVIPESVGQYTGLKDSRGEDIYEGDIIDFEFDTVIFISNGYDVAYKNGAFVVNKPSYNPLVSNCKYIRIVGNKFENPELLKQTP